MRRPRLTFFCELELHALLGLFDDPRIQADLRELDAGVSLALPDLSPERAQVVQQLNQAGIPVVAWLLLPRSEGYYFSLDNWPQAAARYDTFRAWTATNNLTWSGVGLDLELDLEEMQEAPAVSLSRILRGARRAADGARWRRGLAEYRDLVARIRADGHTVETYQFPIIADERRAGSSLLQRISGVMDLPVDCEVLMLYSSLLGPNGGSLWSYARDAQAIGVGSTGGGMDSQPKLTWDQLARDLRLAFCWTDDIYIFSLEGCVQNGYLSRLRDFDWQQPVQVPFGEASGVDRFRTALQAGLWTTAHPEIWLALTALLVLPSLFRRKRPR